MSSIAIITARGGSKRIPKKNIRDFCGKPIIAYSIEAALGAGIFDEVMVSTDSEEIAEIAKRYGASVPFMRSEATSSDYATTRDVLLEVLSNYKDIGMEFDDMVCIYPTAPFLTGKKLRNAMDTFHDNKGSLLIPVVRFSYPPQRAYVINENRLLFKNEEYRYSRSQDLEPYYHEAGQFYCYNIKDYYEANGSIKENIVPYVLAESEVQDIDTEVDWIMAEMKYRLLTEGSLRD
ncbi:MAG: pseudaminic acid cytidylyltransferase [Lachnospiraceae bacterium]|nr:pseudaminic acid cytidylyltransferase [Lachnospiraceae bacterium]